jgi:hypothetical protein
VPIVFFTIMHYKRLLQLNLGDEPDRILLKDLSIQVSIMLWLVSYFVVMYSGIRLFR